MTEAPATLHVALRDRRGKRCRTSGVAIREDETPNAAARRIAKEAMLSGCSDIRITNERTGRTIHTA